MQLTRTLLMASLLTLSAFAQSVGADVIVGSIDSVFQVGNGAGGALVGYAFGTTACNVGTADLAFMANNQHPVIAQNIYRLKAVTGRSSSWPASIPVRSTSVRTA